MPAPGVGHVTDEERGTWDAVAHTLSGNEPALCLGGAVGSFLQVAASTALRDAPGEQSGLDVLKSPQGCAGCSGPGRRLPR